MVGPPKLLYTWPLTLLGVLPSLYTRSYGAVNKLITLFIKLKI